MRKRPISPHLTIYKPMITSVSSIVGRFAGIYTYLIVCAIGIGMAFFIQSGKDVGSMLATVNHFTGLSTLNYYIIMLFSVASIFAFFLYIFALIRHIIWDFGYLLDLKIAKMLGYCMFIFAFLISIGLNYYIFFI